MKRTVILLIVVFLILGYFIDESDARRRRRRRRRRNRRVVRAEPIRAIARARAVRVAVARARASRVARRRRRRGFLRRIGRRMARRIRNRFRRIRGFFRRRRRNRRIRRVRRIRRRRNRRVRRVRRIRRFRKIGKRIRKRVRKVKTRVRKHVKKIGKKIRKVGRRIRNKIRRRFRNRRIRRCRRRCLRRKVSAARCAKRCAKGGRRRRIRRVRRIRRQRRQRRLRRRRQRRQRRVRRRRSRFSWRRTRRLRRRCNRVRRRLPRCKTRACRRTCRRRLRRCAAKFRLFAKRCRSRRCRVRFIRLANARWVKKGLSFSQRLLNYQRRLKRCKTAACRARYTTLINNLNKRRCRKRNFAKLRRTLRRWQRKAATCGAVDEGCVNRSYAQMSRIRTRIARLSTVCSSRVSAVSVVPCNRVRKQLMRWRRRRAILQARVARCGDEDNACVTAGLQKILRLNRLVRRNSARCRITFVDTPTRATCPKPISQLQWIHSSTWRHAVQCDDMRTKWEKWLAFTKERRKRLHCESCRCDPLDAPCLRMSFMQIVHIDKQVREARDAFVTQLRVCDRCAPLKLHFARWIRRQRRRRLRIHNEICRCEPHDVNCAASRVLQIRAIQQEIKRRLDIIQHLHRDCHSSTVQGHDVPLPASWLNFARGGSL